MRHWCICPPRDGFLYVEFPSFDHLRNLLLTQRFRDHAHFRTVDGSVPYVGGGLAFSVVYLRMLGVQPLWYPTPGSDSRIALQQLVADGIYTDEHEAYEYEGHHYPDECEWMGPRGMRFDPQMVEVAWIGWRDRRSVEERLGILASLVPHAQLWSEPPEPTGHKPCQRR